MSMVTDTAELFIAARREKRQVATPSGTLADASAAYAIQDAVARAFGAVRGWKVGAADPVAEPNCAPLLALHRAPAKLAADAFHMLGIEAEIAFTFGADLPARASPYARDEVLAAVDKAHPAIEIVDTRLADWRHAHALWKLADNGSNGAFVYAAGTDAWRGVDFTRQRVELYQDDAKVLDAAGGNTAGDPLRLLHWLAGHLAARCGGIKAGDVVTTGTYSGLRFVEPGCRVRAEFAGIGVVTLEFESSVRN